MDFSHIPKVPSIKEELTEETTFVRRPQEDGNMEMKQKHLKAATKKPQFEKIQY